MSTRYKQNKLTVTQYVQNVHLWHEHKHANMLANGQLHHQSATAPSGTTHAVDAVAFIDVMNSGLLHMLLNDRPNGIIHQIRAGEFSGHISGAIKFGGVHHSSSTVSCARWAGALSC